MPSSDESAIVTRNIKDTRKSLLIGVHCSAKLVQAIDAYIEDQYDSMKRPEAIRKLLIEALAGSYLQKDRENQLAAE